jgi:hypothetical protein
MNISLGVIALSTSSQTVGDLTDFGIRITIATFIPKGASLLVILPSSVFYITESISCKILNEQQACQNI